MEQNKPLIGCIGQGFIGSAYSDDFEARGFEVVRYALEAPHNQNKEKIKDCDIVFIAVPTPTTPEGFDASIVDEALSLIGEGKTAIIKSTLLPGTTNALNEKHTSVFVMHSPEFLRERSAHEDAMHPERNIIGIPEDSEEFRARAEEVLALLPHANYTVMCSAKEAELIKYGGNCFLFTKLIFMNLMYDLSGRIGADFETVSKAMQADPRIGTSHMFPVHASGHVDESNVGRGAGGHCFIKDFAAFVELYKTHDGDETGTAVLEALEKKNIDLLRSSNKDLELLSGVYGDTILLHHEASHNDAESRL